MKSAARLLIALAPIALAGCGGDDNSSPSNPTPSQGTYAKLQFVNASPDAPPIDVLIEGTPWVRHLDYGEGTGKQSIAPGSHTMAVQIETPGAPTTVIGPTTLDAAANMDYVMAVEGYLNSIQSPGVTLVTFPRQLAAVFAQDVRIQLLNIPSDVKVYLTQPGANLSSSALLGTGSSEGSLGPIEVPAGEWEIRMTESGARFGGATEEIYDSGPITLEGGSDLVFLLVPDLLAGTCPPGLFCAALGSILSVVDAHGNSSWPNTSATLRFVHDSPDASPLSLIVDGNVFAWGATATFSYGGSTGYRVFRPGIHELAVVPASNLSDVLAHDAAELQPNSEYTVYALGPLSQLSAFVTYDDLRQYSTQARLRFIQGSLSAGHIDVYLTAAGSGVATAEPTYEELPFTGNTGFVSYVQGAYDLTVTETGSKTPIFGPVSTCLLNGEVSTIVLRDAPGGGPPYGVIGGLFPESLCQ